LSLTLTYSNTYGSEIGDQLRSQLKEVGIDLKVKVVEFSTWLQDVYTDKDYDLSLVDHNESHDFTQWSNPDYYYGYDNEDVRKLTDEALHATDDATRDAKLAQAARIVSEDAAADWLLNYRITTAMDKGVTGFPLNMNQTYLPLWNVAYTPAK
ncbi:MAG: ABC transporter substrate-binding protein, partial [Bifidobacterium castoris]|nr:ABC transporter substrate-binding protein [Bifidobacterium castoris]